MQDLHMLRTCDIHFPVNYAHLYRTFTELNNLHKLFFLYLANNNGISFYLLTFSSYKSWVNYMNTT